MGVQNGDNVLVRPKNAASPTPRVMLIDFDNAMYKNHLLEQIKNKKTDDNDILGLTNPKLQEFYHAVYDKNGDSYPNNVPDPVLAKSTSIILETFFHGLPPPC